MREERTHSTRKNTNLDTHSKCPGHAGNNAYPAALRQSTVYSKKIRGPAVAPKVIKRREHRRIERSRVSREACRDRVGISECAGFARDIAILTGSGREEFVAIEPKHESETNDESHEPQQE